MSIGSTITWLDGQQTVIRNQAEIDMIQWCMWEVRSVSND